jgi:UDP-N-acetyl-D-galactosamine dehydrogenase
MQGIEDVRLAVVGLGYVGLPVAVAFGSRLPTIGFDINSKRIAELKRGRDITNEVTPEEFAAATRISYTDDPAGIADCTVFIITVPTPIDEHKRPDFRPLESASRTVGGVLKAGDLVIYESTVYPGATEEVCVPILEQVSGLVFNQDFYVGYSPERINPGDRTHRLASIRKVTSGSTPQAADLVDALYSSIVTAGTHKASSIRVAEAAKVIENTQRDVNIGLMNELALIFARLGIDTEEVLLAAGTKWNFQPFRPGLVGGHCIGVDPYYLTFKAEAVGHHPEIILSGRRINDAMGSYVTDRVVKMMLQRRQHVAGARILLLGLTFKEDCPDLRNSRAIDIVRQFETYGAQVDIYDPWVDADEAKHEYGVAVLPEMPAPGSDYDAIVLAVAHHQFKDMGSHAIRARGRDGAVLFDVKYALPKEESDARL